jgi:hypothetical protein
VALKNKENKMAAEILNADYDSMEKPKKPAMHIVNPEAGLAEKLRKSRTEFARNTPNSFYGENLIFNGQIISWLECIGKFREGVWKVTLRGQNETLEMYVAKEIAGKGWFKYEGDKPSVIAGIRTERDLYQRLSNESRYSSELEKSEILHLFLEQVSDMFKAGNVNLEGIVSTEEEMAERANFIPQEVPFGILGLKLGASVTLSPQTKPGEEYFFAKIFRASQILDCMPIAYDLQSPFVELVILDGKEKIQVLIDKSKRQPRVIGISSKRPERRRGEIEKNAYAIEKMLEETGKDLCDISKDRKMIVEGYGRDSLPEGYIPVNRGKGIESQNFLLSLCKECDEYDLFVRKALGKA